MQYPQLRAAVAALGITLTAEQVGNDHGKPSYRILVTSPAVRVDGRRLEVISTWSAPEWAAYECLSIMLRMADEMRDAKNWDEAHGRGWNLDGYYTDHEQLYARLRWVLTDEQITTLLWAAEDDEADNENENG